MKTAKQKERELILKLSKEKKTCREIGDILGISKSKVSYWVNRYKNIGNLLDKPRSGRPTKLTKQELNEIKNSLRDRHIKAENRKAGISTKEVLQLIEQKTERKYSFRHAERIMHKIGLSLITPQISHLRKDEKAQAKFREEFKKKFGRNIWAFQ